MCTGTFGTLTLDGMLSDPLIQAMMRSDGVQERDHAALLLRVKNSLDERGQMPSPVRAPRGSIALLDA